MSIKNRIILAKSSVKDRAPSADLMQYGELFINYADGKLFYKSADNQVKTFEAASNIEDYVLRNSTNIPFVAGTQTEPTVAWTGVAETFDTLEDGAAILYWLPYDCTEGSVTLTLTTSSGEGDPQPCYWSDNVPLKTHYSQGSVIGLVYRVDPRVNGSVGKTGWYVISHQPPQSHDTIKTLDIMGLFTKK